MCWRQAVAGKSPISHRLYDILSANGQLFIKSLVEDGQEKARALLLYE